MGKLSTLLIATLLATPVMAKRAGVPATRDSRSVMEVVTRGQEKAIITGKAVEASQQRGQANQEMELSASSAKVIESCTGNCELPSIVEDIAMNKGKKRQLSAEAMSNLTTASKRAAELVDQKFSAEEAQEIALREMGLEPEKVEENCK